MPLTRCRQPGCSGSVGEDGFCDICGVQPLPDGADEHVPPGRPEESPGFGELPQVEVRSPESQVQPDAEVPETHRVCGSCNRLVGQSKPGRPALTSGFCPRCGTPFSFRPRLRSGDRLGHYEVVDPLAHGGAGWVYLAKDSHLDGRWVAIKGLIDENDPKSAETVVNERKYLIALDHENIVRILDFVIDSRGDKPIGYIVMEYVGGKSLWEIKDLAQRGNRPLPVEHVVTYGLQILDALAYLHGRGLVYCDLKPDNVIHQRRRVKLIDLGAACERGFTGEPWVTRGFTVPRKERVTRGMQPDMDLYSLGRTLAALFANSPESCPPDSSGPLEAGLKALKLTLARATEDDFRKRFSDAAEMREQLEGVLRQITALRGNDFPPKRSARFAATVELLDNGLGAPPPLSRWTAGPATEAVLDTDLVDDATPKPETVAPALPAPLPDPADPAAGLLTTATTDDPQRLLVELANLGERSVESDLARCRARLALGELDDAEDALDAAARRAGDDDWRIHWHTGLAKLRRGKSGDAGLAFGEVHRILPGELIPRLALAYCAEIGGAPADAARHFEVVWQTDRAAVGAAFGLARTHLARREPGRDRAVAVLDTVGATSKYFDAARTAALRVRSSRFGEARPDEQDVTDAVGRLTALATTDAAGRARLVTVVRQAALRLLRDGAPKLPEGRVLGVPVTVHTVRLLLEISFRELAGQAADDDQHDTLIDLANTVRPKTRW